MIGLGARLALSGGRESAVRLVLTAIGVAIGTTLLLLSAAVDPAIRSQQKHEAWQYTGREHADREGSNDPLLWHLVHDRVAGEELLVLWVAPTGPTAPVPLGLDEVPAPGEVHMSPALAALVEEMPAARLADRFPAGPSGSIGDEHLAGPDQLVAVVGTSPEDLQGEEGVMEVRQIRTRPSPFQFSDGLRAALAIGIVGLLMPVLVFVSTSTRLGAARREQRFAALRLAGATPRQTNVIAAVEAGATAVVGTVAGIAGYALLRPRIATIDIDGHPPFLADVQVPLPMFVAIVVGVPILAVVTAMVSIRRLRISPLGVARRAVRARPTFRRLAPLLVGAVSLAVTLGLARGARGMAGVVPVMVAFAVLIYGVIAAGPWLTVLTARAIGRTSRRATSLLAGRRLEDDPSGGFRAVSGLVVAVFVASVFSGMTPAFIADNGIEPNELIQETTMIAPLGIDGEPAEVGRAALEAALAAGAGHGVLLHVDPDPDRALADPERGRSPTQLVACDGLPGLELSALDLSPCRPGGTAWVEIGPDPVLEPAPYTAAQLQSAPVEALVVTTDGSIPATDRIRTAISRAAPTTAAWLGAERAYEGNRRLAQLNRLANLALAVTLVIAGCSLAVAVAGGIIERKRPFALLRLSGMRLAELRQVALVEAAAPLLLIAAASAALGLATAAVILEISAGVSWQAPTADYWLSLAGGLAVALGVAAATLPLLGRATSFDAVRFE